MGRTFTAVITRDGPWWVGWIKEIPGINCQERTKEELLETLRVTLQEALELQEEESRSMAGQDFEEELIAL